MKFILYNIRYGTGGKVTYGGFLPYITGYLSGTEKHIKKIGEFLKNENPDVVGLVEVDLGSIRHGFKNQVEKLGEFLNHFTIEQIKYGENSKFHKVPVLRNQGNAFLYKDELQNAKFHYFEEGTKTLIIELELENVVFFLVHLALGAKTRLKQINQLYKLIKVTKKPIILGGDFNLMLGEVEIELFLEASGLVNPNKENMPTFPSWKASKHLDFILHSPEIIINEFKVPNVTLSDHLPIIIDFEIDNNQNLKNLATPQA